MCAVTGDEENARQIVENDIFDRTDGRGEGCENGWAGCGLYWRGGGGRDYLCPQNTVYVCVCGITERTNSVGAFRLLSKRTLMAFV